MKKVTGSSSSPAPTVDLFDDDSEADGVGFLINRPEAVGSSGLAQNSNFYEKLQLAQQSLRSQETTGFNQPGLFPDVVVDAASVRGGPLDQSVDSFLPLVSPATSKPSVATGLRAAGGAVFPQELDIITVGGETEQFATGGGIFQDFEFGDEPEVLRPAGDLFRASSQLQVHGEQGEEGLRFPGKVLDDATTRKIGGR